MKRRIRVLIVEDELIAAEYLAQMLESHGTAVVGVVDRGDDAVRTALQEHPDVVLMDIMLRGNVSGAEAAVRLHRKAPQIKIIFLTAYADAEMVDYAVEAQAAGYLSKPYNEAEIIATLRLATEGTNAYDAPQVVHERAEEVKLENGYLFDFKKNRLLRHGSEIALGPRALKLVALLCTQPGISVSHEQIEMHVWGAPVNDRTLRSLIFRIRHLTDETLIENISGTGYRVRPEKSGVPRLD